jgi:hypothetical protein
MDSQATLTIHGCFGSLVNLAVRGSSLVVRGRWSVVCHDGRVPVGRLSFAPFAFLVLVPDAASCGSRGFCAVSVLVAFVAGFVLVVLLLDLGVVALAETFVLPVFVDPALLRFEGEAVRRPVERGADVRW